MSGGWAGIAGAFGFLGNQISQNAQEQRQEKLKEMEDAAQEKRETFLAQFRANLQDQNSSNRNDRGIARDAAKHDLTLNDVSRTFKDASTGNQYVTTKSGETYAVNETSPEFQQQLNTINQGKADAGALAAPKIQAGIDRAGAQTANYDSLTAKRDAAQPPMSPEDKQATGYYKSAVQQQFGSYNKDKKDAEKNGQDMSKYPAFDFGQAAMQARDQMDTLYGEGSAARLMGNAGTTPSPRNPVMPVVNDGSAPAADAPVAPAPTANPRSSRVATAAAPGAPAPFAEGKMLKGPGNKLYVVRNGVPVLLGGGAPVQQPPGVTNAQ